MIKKTIHISFLCLIGLSLVGSVIHYHEKSLSCLDHAKEQHYVESDDYCPLTLVRGNAIISQIVVPSSNNVDSICFASYAESMCLASPTDLHLGRAPPA